MRSCHHEQLIWQGVPRLQRGALSPTGSRHVVLRANFDGQGIREESLSISDSFGLRGIRERAWLLGGHFTVQGQQGKGTAATVQIPIDS
jgi:signal transduction histidine kinase